MTLPGNAECEGGKPQISTWLPPIIQWPAYQIMRPPGKLPRRAFNFNDCQAGQRKTDKGNSHTFGGNETNFQCQQT